jgi:hypothetical protein
MPDAAARILGENAATTSEAVGSTYVYSVSANARRESSDHHFASRFRRKSLIRATAKKMPRFFVVPGMHDSLINASLWISAAPPPAGR